MSVYFREGRGWMYDFVLNKKRYTSNYYKTKAEAQRAEALRREEIRNPEPGRDSRMIPTDMAFLELVNRRLDHVQAYNSEHHYRVYKSLSKQWVKRWGGLLIHEITQRDIEEFVLKRAKVSPYTANRELRSLRATFNWARKKGLALINPTEGLEFLPVEKRVKYVPTSEDIDLVIAQADPDTQDYLWVIRDTMGRVSEINRLKWDDINLQGNFLLLYTRKKRGGNLTPRKVPLTTRLHGILKRRFEERDPSKPWVFWHRYKSRKTGGWVEGPYKDRKKFMRTLCKKAGVKYFRFHALRHAGASLLDEANVPLGAIQRILGHESRQTTEIYLHSIGRAEQDAIHVLELAGKKSQPKSQPNEKRGLRLVT